MENRSDRRLTRQIIAAAAVLTLAVSIALAGVASWQAILYSTLSLACFMAPGVLFAARMFGQERGGRLTAVAIGPLWGFGLSSLVLLGFWATGARSAWLVVVVPLVGSLTALVASRLRNRLTMATLTQKDVLALLLVLLVVPLVVGLPFSRVGAQLPEGRAYRAYFTADYVWRMAVVAELAKGDMLPRNPFYRGDPLRYYWLPHLFSAWQYRQTPDADINELLLSQSIWIDLAFIAFLYVFVRQFVPSPTAATLACLGAILFTSFEGLQQIVVLWRWGVHLDWLRQLNIDAITRWVFSGIPIDGLHRLLLYQPQHAVGYLLGLSGLLVVVRRVRPVDGRIMVLAGCLFGLALLISSFGAVMLISAAAIFELFSAIPRPNWRALVIHAVAAGLPIVGALLLVQQLSYVDRSAQLLVLGLNRAATQHVLVTTILSFGPLLLLSIWGAVVSWRQRDRQIAPIAALVFVCVLFYFFVDVRGHQHVYVTWRSGHLLFIAFAVLSGGAVDWMIRQGSTIRRYGSVVVFLLVLAATPTTVIDLYNTQDIWNRGQAPGFRWTLILTPDEQAALNWIRQFTPPRAIVQVDALARHSETWAYVPAFAERRMAIGLPISMVPIGKYELGVKRIREIYRAPTADDAYDLAARLRIDYIVVGRPERTASPRCQARFDGAPHLFNPVFRTPSVTVYFVARGGRLGDPYVPLAPQ